MEDFIKWVATDTIKPNRGNPNHHPQSQIDILAKYIEYQGWRAPLIVSNQSGLLVSGHGRLLAAKKLGLDKVPVSYQDFTPEQEKAHLISDNTIPKLSQIDLGAVNQILPELGGGDFTLDMLALGDFSVDPMDKPQTKKACPNCGHEM